MKECIKTEVKTLIHMKSISIGLLLLLIIPSYFFYSNYEYAKLQVNFFKASYNEIHAITSEEEIDTTDIDDSISMIHKTYEPHMVLNNSFAVLTGISIIILPIIFSLYIGNEYSRSRVIKAKITHYSLVQVFTSKIIVICLSTLFIGAIYAVLNIYLSQFYWNKFLAEYFADFTNTNVIKVSNFEIITLTTFLVLFYIMICFTITILFKSSIAGIITTIIINYVTLPTKYSFNNMFFDLINKTFFISEASPFMFPIRSTEVLPVHIELIILITFFLVLLSVIPFAGLRQKNS